jgi:hypothetical protein
LSRLAATPSQLQRLLEALATLGFVPKRVQVSPDGSITLHSEGGEPTSERDLLKEWEARRGGRQVQ